MEDMHFFVVGKNRLPSNKRVVCT